MEKTLLDELWGISEKELAVLDKATTGSKINKLEKRLDPMRTPDAPRKRPVAIQTSWQHMYKGGPT